MVALGFVVTPAAATEKYWIAHEAQLIVVGTFQPGRGFWWLDGWHETGTITLNEVLYGRTPAGQINFRLTIRCYMQAAEVVDNLSAIADILLPRTESQAANSLALSPSSSVRHGKKR